jgi:hypothetical protein
MSNQELWVGRVFGALPAVMLVSAAALVDYRRAGFLGVGVVVGLLLVTGLESVRRAHLARRTEPDTPVDPTGRQTPVAPPRGAIATTREPATMTTGTHPTSY